MTANIDPDTGVAYGYISANALHPDIVQELQDNGTDVYYADAVKEAKAETVRDLVERACQVLENELSLSLDEDALEPLVKEHVEGAWDGSRWEQAFNNSYQPDEPIHEGTYMLGDGNWVKYRTSWLGGALNVWIFESPYTTETAGRASPCVPNAGILDSHGDVRAFDVPPDWLDEEAQKERKAWGDKQ